MAVTSFSQPTRPIRMVAKTAVPNKILGGVPRSPGQYDTPRCSRPFAFGSNFQISVPVSGSSATITWFSVEKYRTLSTTMGVVSKARPRSLVW